MLLFQLKKATSPARHYGTRAYTVQIRVIRGRRLPFSASTETAVPTADDAAETSE